MAPTDLHPCPLPPRPTTYEEWREYRPTYLSAYSLAFDAENYATNQAEANENREDDIISARVAGYLLVELFTQLATERPCNSLAKQLLSQAQESEDTHDVIFRVGKWHRDHLLRCCVFNFFPTPLAISIFLQFENLPPSTPESHGALRGILPSTRWKRLSRSIQRLMARITRQPGVKCVPIHYVFLSLTPD